MFIDNWVEEESSDQWIALFDVINSANLLKWKSQKDSNRRKPWRKWDTSDYQKNPQKPQKTSEDNLIALICFHFHTHTPNTVCVFHFLVHQVEQ